MGRISVGRSRKPRSGGRDRYTFVPAAVGSSSGLLHLGDVDPQQMIRGGAHSPNELDKKHNGKSGTQMDVPMVDVVKWVGENFKPEDYIMLKMDVEGAEHQILPAMIDKGLMALI